MAELDKEYFAHLYRIYQDYHGPTLGDSATKHHILKHVFGIVPETIHGPVEITRCYCPGIAVVCVAGSTGSLSVDVLGRRKYFAIGRWRKLFLRRWLLSFYREMV